MWKDFSKVARNCRKDLPVSKRSRGGHTHPNEIQVGTSKLLQQSADILVKQLHKIQQFVKQIDEQLKEELELKL